MKKTKLWKSLCESDTLEMFVNMKKMITHLKKLNLMFWLIYLTNLRSNFKNRFPDLTLQQHEWMRNPFAVTIGEKISHLSFKAKEGISDGTFLWYSSQNQVWKFVSSWILDLYKKEYLELSQLATEVLLIFETTYLYEKNIFSNGSNWIEVP
jgi:hypothetical protein